MIVHKTLFTGAVAFFILVTVLLVLPGSVFPQDRLLATLHVDKLVHVGLFAMLTFLFSASFQPLSRNASMVVFLSGCAYGIAMEFVQKYWALDRSFEIADMLADAVGCGVGMLVCRWLVQGYLKK